MSMFSTLSPALINYLDARADHPRAMQEALADILPTHALINSASHLAVQDDVDSALIREGSKWRIVSWEDPASTGGIRVTGSGVESEDRIQEVYQLRGFATASEWAALEGAVGPLSEDL